MMKTYKCLIDNRWMWSLERATLTIRSPKGGSIIIDKWHVDKTSESQSELIWKIANCTEGSILLTLEELNTLASIPFPAAVIYQKRKPKPQLYTVASRTMCNRCQKPYKLKNHGSWTGYFCSSCKDGGSFNNKPTRGKR